jgi:energy-coupling factor transporter ATP-binding protein EcfA2
MKQVQVEPDPLPGYELLWLDTGKRIFLTLADAQAHRHALRERKKADDAAQSEQARLDEEARELETEAASKAESKEALAKRQAWTEPPAPGFYRVLPKLAELLDQSATEAASLRSADDDVNRRRAKLVALLAEKGPDRRLAQPAEWRAALDSLEASLPHFREPIACVRRAMALGEATGKAVRVPPMLLLGPQGVGKTHFTHRLAEVLQATHGAIPFDQPSGGSGLRGSDHYWGNSSTGLLFNLLCLGDCANPVILLDELDKSVVVHGVGQSDPLAQLHGALEPETSRCLVDASVEVEMDASMVTYVATANAVRGVGAPLLSRMEVFCIEPPTMAESVEVARAIVGGMLEKLDLAGRVRFDRQALVALAHFSPRLMVRAAQGALGTVLEEKGNRVGEEAVLAAARMGSDAPRLH